MSTSFEDRLRDALADEVPPAPTIHVSTAPVEIARDAGPYHWKLTPIRSAEGLIIECDLWPIARVSLG